MKHNICVIGLNNGYVSKLGKEISDALEMYFADITELIKYELMDVEYARHLAGDDYVHKVESSKVKMINGFENTLFAMDYSLLNDDKNLKVAKENSYIIYLKLSKENIKNMKNGRVNTNLIYDVYEFRDVLCKKYCDVEIDCNNKKTNEIINDIKKWFLQK